MDIKEIKKDFPILDIKVNNKPLIYLDNAATTQKPIQVIEAISDYYKNYNANVHRGVHTLSQIATDKFEAVREQIKNFINAKESSEIIYTRGTTESINLLASSLSYQLEEDDEIIISESEHHSNIVPWQIACQRTKAKLKVLPIKEDGAYDLEKLETLLSDKTRIVSLAQVSNSLGIIHRIKEIIQRIRKINQRNIEKKQRNILTIVDGAQGIPHLKVDVQDLGCDFYCFSAHKIYAPMGIGVLYGRKELLEEMHPYQGGGEMIKEVTFEKTTYNVAPYRFEAGTPSVADVIGFGKALEYINNIGLENIISHEDKIMRYATERLQEIEGVRIIGTAPEKAGAISFLIGESHPFDVGTLLDQLGIAIRTGHHCAQPVMQHYNIPGTARASFALYTDFEDIDKFADSLKRVALMLQ
ncbi:MAG: cysteine desulfurase [Bacteroidales bacterium]|nr:cysteine desulfurase [Bacteroidales bacterium]MEE1226174.1 cysteine desulfurase [Bacteroidales bacterium]